MKLQLSFRCPKCDKLNPVPAIVGKPIPDITCIQCHERYMGTGDLDVTSGVLARSGEELEKGDYTLTIIFAAMAVECEIARLYFKWRMIDEPCLASDKLEDEFRKITRVVDRLDAVAKLLTSSKFNKFARDLKNKAIHEQLFQPRNRILHFGETNFDIERARRCLTVSRATLDILVGMDETRRLTGQWQS